MGMQDKPSVQAAKYAIFEELKQKSGFTFNTLVVRINGINEPLFKIVFTKFDIKLSTNIHRVMLKYEDCDHKYHNLRLKLGNSFLWDNGWDSQWSLRMLPRKWSSEIFDQLCAFTNAGNSLVLLTSNPLGNKKDKTVFMHPYEGARRQIEADLKAPDFASLDWRETMKTPF